MKKLLICVKSCQPDRVKGYHDVIRSTYGERAKAAGVEVRFFMGNIDNISVNYQHDEVALKCGDDYNSLPFKTREICRWARAKLFDHVFLCDTDTYVKIPALLTCGYQGYDYTGKIDRPIGVPFAYDAIDRQQEKEHHKVCYPWASGGHGYFLSRAAVQLVSTDYPSSWAEDLWVGQVMGVDQSEGNATILDIPGGTYSSHHPEHGEIYDLPKLADWMRAEHNEYAR